MKQIFIAATASLMMLAASGTAQAEVSNPNGEIYDFNVYTLQSFLSDRGTTSEIKTNNNGEQYLTMTDPSTSLNYGIMPQACGDSGKCLGANMFVSFTSSITYEEINTLNNKYSFVSIGKNNETSMSVSRYEICDHGVKRGTLDVSLLNLLAIAKKVQGELYTE